MKNLNKMKIAGDMQFEIGQDKVSHFPTWEVKDDKTLCKKVEDLKHSTFDKSKFTVVGSPTITDDGIASGFRRLADGAVGFKIPSIDFSKSFTIKGYIPNIDITKSSTILNLSGDTSGTTKLYFETGYGTPFLKITIGGVSLETIGINTNSFYFKISFDGNNIYTLSYKTNKNDEWINKTATIQSLISASENIIIGYVDYTYLNGSIDLKQFSITVDGKEVFSGNKTGLDVIKPDNYTVVGSPVISDDGIFSWNAKNESVTYFSNNALNTTNYEIRTRVIISNKTSLCVEETGYTQFLHCYSRNIDVIQLYTIGTSNIQIHGSGFSYVNLVSNALNYNIIDIVIANDGTLFTATAIDGETGIVISKITSATSGSELSLTTTNLKIASNTFFMSATATYKVDLNYTKVYVDGNLVYQPCLKIPYTQSKTGSKIVDVAYRDRVQDLFEQVGYNGYFTLGENDFTLPTHKFSDVIDCYENGINKWEQRVDRTLRQQGSCTAGTEVALLKPYTDDENYALSVPYSAKTASSFIPTVTGDWFAEGKITL